MLSRQEETGFTPFEPQLVEVPDQRSSQAALLGQAAGTGAFLEEREWTNVRRE